MRKKVPQIEAGPAPRALDSQDRLGGQFVDRERGSARLSLDLVAKRWPVAQGRSAFHFQRFAAHWRSLTISRGSRDPCIIGDGAGLSATATICAAMSRQVQLRSVAVNGARRRL